MGQTQARVIGGCEEPEDWERRGENDPDVLGVWSAGVLFNVDGMEWNTVTAGPWVGSEARRRLSGGWWLVRSVEVMKQEREDGERMRRVESRRVTTMGRGAAAK
jgi:hypothetical protein